MLPKEKLRISQTTVDLVYPILWCFCFWVFHPLISSERHGCGGRKCLATGSLFSKQFVPKKTSGQKEWETRTHGLGELINWKARNLQAFVSPTRSRQLFLPVPRHLDPMVQETPQPHSESCLMSSGSVARILSGRRNDASPFVAPPSWGSWQYQGFDRLTDHWHTHTHTCAHKKTQCLRSAPCHL